MTTISDGEVKLATRAGLWSADQLCGDIPELLTGRASKPDWKRPVFFRSIGLGFEDIAAAVAVLATARS